MFIAVDENNQRVYAKDAVKGKKYFCSACMAEVHSRIGKIRIVHFAHVSAQDCDPWKSDMTEWHRAWQARFPLDNQEIVVRNGEDFHRADVKIDDTVIEFQHSPITHEEFWARNNFYNKNHLRVIWLFDLTEEVQKEKLYRGEYQFNKNAEPYTWKYSWKTFSGFAHKKYDGRIFVFFQMTASADDETGIRQLIEYQGKTILLDDKIKFTPDTFIEYCNTSQVDPSIFPPEDAINLWDEKYTIGDLQDVLKSHKSKTFKGWVVECPKKNRPEYYENCQACKYNHGFCSNNPHADKIKKELQRKAAEITPDFGYYEHCTYRFQELYDKWDIYHDRVLELNRAYGEVVDARTTAGDFPNYNKQPSNKDMSVDAPKHKVSSVPQQNDTPRTIRELLAASGAVVIGVVNNKRNIEAKVHQSQGKYGPIYGYIRRKGEEKYSQTKMEIFYANNREWKLDWEHNFSE